MVAIQTKIKKRNSNRNWAIQAIERLMVANQTEKNENLTETGQYRRLRDSWWRMIMVANQTEIKKIENLADTGQYRRMKDSTWRFIEKERLKIERQEQKMIYKWWRLK